MLSFSMHANKRTIDCIASVLIFNCMNVSTQYEILKHQLIQYFFIFIISILLILIKLTVHVGILLTFINKIFKQPKSSHSLDENTSRKQRAG